MATAPQLTRAIVHTLAYFDLCAYPLSTSELWRYLFLPSAGDEPLPVVSLAAVAGAATSQLLQHHQGFIMLAGQSAEKLVARRQANFVRSEQQWRRLRPIGRLLALVPGVRLIFVSNTLSYDNSGPDSDIDLVIVTAPGSLWLVRGICLALLSILKLRPGQTTNSRSVCLSFFIDTDHLDLGPTALPRIDIHFAYWTEQLVPYYDAGGWFARFAEANGWVKRMLPQALQTVPHPRRAVVLSSVERAVKNVLERLTASRWLEQLAEKYSRRRFPALISQKLNRDVGVIVKPGMIKLITNDRREGYRNEWIVKAGALTRQLDSPSV